MVGLFRYCFIDMELIIGIGIFEVELVGVIGLELE